MIRKQTWILLFIFAVLAGAAFYLQKNPLDIAANATPSPTAQASLVEGWAPADITRLEYQNTQGTTTLLEKRGTSGWVYQPEGQIIDGGKVEELTTEITSARVITSLDSGFDLAAVGLTKSTNSLKLTNANGKIVEIHIGNMTPTKNGYYIQVNQEAPVVVSVGAIQAILDLMTRENLLNLTPTPESSPLPIETKEP